MYACFYANFWKQYLMAENCLIETMKCLQSTWCDFDRGFMVLRAGLEYFAEGLFVYDRFVADLLTVRLLATDYFHTLCGDCIQIWQTGQSTHLTVLNILI